jgi:hypothetical protein
MSGDAGVDGVGHDFTGDRADELVGGRHCIYYSSR